MRPILRGPSPQPGDFSNYRDAFRELVSRLGMFCNYCERRIATQLAVEHIQPKKGPFGRPELTGCWDNFLLVCVNCNSTKKDKEVVLEDVLLPDRDNTAAAYEYAMDGKVSISEGLTPQQQTLAGNTLALVGLDKCLSEVLDSNGELVAVDRVAQRMEVWLIAGSSKEDLRANPTDEFRRQIARTATGHGFFSIWMAVFADDADVRRLLIGEFPGTAANCFNTDSLPVSPRPQTGLANGSKV